MGGDTATAEIGLFPASEFPPPDDAPSILNSAEERHAPFAVFAAFSGGNDSLAAAKFASTHPRFAGCFHANTGTGIPETLEFVRRTCMREGWPLYEYATDPSVYRGMVLKDGFPGPPLHYLYYRNLKERRLREFLRDQKRGRPWNANLLLVTGVRRSESRRRMGTAAAIQKQGSLVWAAPLLNWGKEQVGDYVADREQNPVSKALGMSGECLCGCFAEPGEMDRIGHHFPDTADRIVALEAEVKAKGLPAVWDERPPRCHRQPPDPNALTLSLCVGCELRHPAPESAA